jgi:predicted Abi (CAAX) family protease
MTPRRWRRIGGLALLALILVPFTGVILRLAYVALHRSFGLVVDLALIGLVLFLVAAFFAPLDALGWWAGWTGDGLEAAPPTGALAVPVATDRPIRRFVVYLDGIGQASDQALPEGEDFLRRLGERLPDDVAIVRGIMPYSVRNQPMTDGRWLGRFWRLVDRLRLRNPQSLLGLIINLRNVTVVAVSADQRYGPIYNQGTAQVILDSLLANGYRLGSGTPLTLLGFSGGGQIALGALPHLRRALAAPVEVISLGGVFSGGNRFLEAAHVYHLTGSRDRVTRIGPLLFPRRWTWLSLSYWNRARRRGRVSLVPLGPVGHELPGGILDAQALLPDGRSHMRQTVDLVNAILQGRFLEPAVPRQRPNNYERARANPWHLLEPARDTGPLPPGRFRPVAAWLGRLILPSPEAREAGVGFEVFHAPEPWTHLIGSTVPLHWHDPRLADVVMDVHFTDEASDSLRDGFVHPERLNHWRQVTPLESLAGSRPHDDQLVALPEPVEVQAQPAPRLTISTEPRQTTGVALGLVRFEAPLEADRWRARCFEPERRDFTGPELILRLPETVANGEGILPATSAGLERNPLNREGWFASGVPDGDGAFVVQALAPRQLLRLRPERIITGRRDAWRYVKREAWRQLAPGTVHSVLLSGRHLRPEDLLAEWREGDRLLVVHVYGGIGGEQREKALSSGLYFGHFAYGLAEVVREPLADELGLQVQYRQVYAHNEDGLIAGAHDWWRYMGDRQVGWLGTRPVADILLRFPPFSASYDVAGRTFSPIDGFERQLAAMTARYRIGDGTGATFVGPANNCAQDSNQALFAAIQQLSAGIRALDPAVLRDWERSEPGQAERFEQLQRLERSLRRELLPFGRPRQDWREHAYTLGSSLEDRPVRNLLRGLSSWRTMLPRLASDSVVKAFLRHGASALVLRTNQVGGEHPQIAPVAPITF